MDRINLLERAASSTGEIVRTITVDTWSAPTPCPDMTVGGIVEHLVGGLTQFADVGAGEPPDFSDETSLAQADASVAYDRACDRMLSIWSRPECVERTYSMPWGETAGADMVGFMIIEQVVHGWDLARAIDREPTDDDALAEATLALAHTYDNEAIRVPPMFAPIVDIEADAPTIDRLAAFLGRNPGRWNRPDGRPTRGGSA